MRRSVLIISPHFPPTNAPDHQRVRTAIPYLAEAGWTPTVLAVKPEYVQAPRDEWLLRTLPEDLEVHRVTALPVEFTSRFGLSTLSFRCRRAIRDAGDKLLSEKKYDLVYFSTTQMGVHRLGLRWKHKFGVPFVMDLQDPWVNDYYAKNRTVAPPGGRLKHAIAQLAARRDEPRCLAAASAVTSVSGRYLKDIAARYPRLAMSKFRVIPFGASELDFEIARREPVSQSHIDFNDGLLHWVAVGASGAFMHPALRLLFNGFQQALAGDAACSRIRMHFLGTSYAPADRARATVLPIARECRVEELVSERPARIPYSEALQCIVNAAVLMIIGSDDSGYNPSKAASYLMAGRPLLAILHDESPAASIVRQSGGRCVTFRPSAFADSGSIADVIRELTQGSARSPTLPGTLSARWMAGQLAELFDEAVRRRIDEVSPRRVFRHLFFA